MGADLKGGLWVVDGAKIRLLMVLALIFNPAANEMFGMVVMLL